MSRAARAPRDDSGGGSGLARAHPASRPRDGIALAPHATVTTAITHRGPRATHAQEVASIAIKKQMSSGFAGEHGDAYQTGTVMGFILLCAIIIGISGCFAIHAHHTTKSDGAKPTTAKSDKQKKVAPVPLEVSVGRSRRASNCARARYPARGVRRLCARARL